MFNEYFVSVFTYENIATQFNISISNTKYENKCIIITSIDNYKLVYTRQYLMQPPH